MEHAGALLTKPFNLQADEVDVFMDPFCLGKDFCQSRAVVQVDFAEGLGESGVCILHWLHRAAGQFLQVAQSVPHG